MQRWSPRRPPNLKAERLLMLFVAQRFHRIEPGREISRNERGQRANQKRADTDDPDILGYDLRRNLRKLVNLTREDFDVQGRGEPPGDSIAITDQGHAET